MIDKVEKLEHLASEQSQLIADMKNKEIVLDEKTTIMHRKLEKNCFETAEIKNIFRRF